MPQMAPMPWLLYELLFLLTLAPLLTMIFFHPHLLKKTLPMSFQKPTNWKW